MKDLILSQSMLKDWNSGMCKLAFKHKWMDYENEEDNPFYIGNKQAVRWGNFFEQQIIGISRGGKLTQLTDKERKSVYYERVMEQSRISSAWLSELGGKMTGVQQRLEAHVEHEGVKMIISGNVDINYQFKDGSRAVIDLKTTGDTESDYGPFQWGNLERIDIRQLCHYKWLMETIYKEPVDAYFYVADLSPKKKVLALKIDISDWTMMGYKDAALEAYKQISTAYNLDWFDPTPTYNECKSCPLRDTCKYAIKAPDIQVLEF